MHQKGFSQKALAILAGLVIAAGVGYYMVGGVNFTMTASPDEDFASLQEMPIVTPPTKTQETAPATVKTEQVVKNTPKFSVTPKSGTAPLTVTITIEQPKEYGKGYALDFGNGHFETVTGNSCMIYHCSDTRSWEAVYKQPGTYNVKVTAIKPDCAGGKDTDAEYCITNTVVATETITVTAASAGYDEQLDESQSEPMKLIVASGATYYLSISIPVKYDGHVKLEVTPGVFDPQPEPYADPPEILEVNGSTWQIHGAGDAGCSVTKYVRVPPSDKPETVLVRVVGCEGEKLPTQAEILKILGSLTHEGMI